MNDTITVMPLVFSGITVSVEEYVLDAPLFSDGNGNIIKEVAGSVIKTYKYDEQNRLIRYDDSGLGQTYVYTYDARGNILSCKFTDYVDEATAVDESTLSGYAYTYGDTTWADLLTGFDGETITYDEAGNPLNWTGGRTLTWILGRNLETVTDVSTVTTYGYDENGLRTSKSISNGGRSTQYYVSDGTYLGEKTTNRGAEYLITYLYGDSGVIGIEVNGTKYFFVKNLQGDVTAIINSAGTVVARYTYDAYGYCYTPTDANGNKITSETHIANLNPFRYRNYMYDTETGLYYLQSRYYDPTVGRFLNADVFVSTGQGLSGYNMFAYCNNNPVMYSDSNGDCAIFAIIVSAVVVTKTIGSFLKKAVAKLKKEESSSQTTVESLTDDQKVLVSTIAAEATVTAKGTYVSSEARQAMANVALNRVGSREWSQYTTVAEICMYTGFDGYGNEDYEACLEYLNNRDGSNAVYEAIILDVMAAYEYDITGGCQLYYTPSAMCPAGSSPNWNFNLLEEVIISGVDTYYEGRFYKYK